METETPAVDGHAEELLPAPTDSSTAVAVRPAGRPRIQPLERSETRRSGAANRGGTRWKPRRRP